MSLLGLPAELRLQIWSHIMGPTMVYPCECATKSRVCQAHRLDSCCQNASTYKHCDNRILRVNHLIFSEAQPLVQQAEKNRIFVLCNNLCLDNFFKSLNERDWKWAKHLRVDLFVGWGNDNQDEWFLCQSNRWAKRYVAGALHKYNQSREVVVIPADEVKQDGDGRMTLMVDTHLS
ncbi:hypothetical protein PV11_06662 [Exophiala sideris]|uniref:Uncharacterized protein n=1 Tax=Exophiala sideris TaxID=1016849 RepID=A0A0D1VSM2_9EURO|nr:hypothetical protein PV11_06662 [Exophiala sideris]